MTTRPSAPTAVVRRGSVADAVPFDGRELERVVPDPSSGRAVPAAVTVAAPAVCAPFAVWFVWLVAGRPAWPARPVARPERLVGATPAAETLGAVDARAP